MDSSLLDGLFILASVTSVISVSLLAILIFLYIPLRDRYTILKNNRLDFFSKHLENLSNILNRRTGLSEYLYALEIDEDQVEFADVEKSIENYVLFCIEETKNIFESFTGNKCACSIKLINREEGDQYTVQTFARDLASGKQRKVVDNDLPKLSLADHSPFQKIIVDQSRPRGFVSNDLASLMERDLYANANPAWNSFYNATCVVPIASTEPNGRRTVLGFVCIDSLHGRFDSKFSLGILEIIASTLYYVFETKMQIEEMFTDDAADQV